MPLPIRLIQPEQDRSEFLAARMPTQTITATVDWNVVQGRTTGFNFGLNAFQGFRSQSFNQTSYRRNLSIMRPGLLRFHNASALQDSSTPDGLIDTDLKTWDRQKIKAALTASFSAFGANQPQRMINIPTWADWMDADRDGFLDLDQIDAFAKLCADLVRIVNKESQFEVKYWEITNEKDDRYFTQFRRDGGWGGLKDANKPDRLNELITIYNKAATAMKKVDPTIQVGGPALARSDLQPFYIPFIKGTVANLDFFTYHFYATGSASTPDPKIYQATQTIASRTETMVNALKAASPKRSIPVMLSEYNISWTWETRDPRMTNHKGVVFDALSMVRALEAGAIATLAWNEKDGVYGKMDDQSNLRVGGRLFQLLNQFLVGDRFTSVTSDKNAITSLAVYNLSTQSRSYLLINHSNRSHTIQVNFRGWQPKNQRLTQHLISDSGYKKTNANWNTIQNRMVVPANAVMLIVFAA